MKKRDIGIDVLKCIAAVLITNSHMESLYPYEALATGGAIGDVLFFFASGFVLFLKPMGRFDDWYKKRINRIYPTVFAWGIISTLFFGNQNDIIQTILYGGGWFVTCIMIYYVIIYFINRFMLNRLGLACFIAILIIVVWYLLMDRSSEYNMYGSTYFKWGHYFLFMLMGAIMGRAQKPMEFRFLFDFSKLLACLVLFYGLLYAGRQWLFLNDLQIISLLPLLGLTYYFYKVANSAPIMRVYYDRLGGPIIKTIGGLCLEIYLVQFSLFTDTMNDYFPLNLVAMFLIILVVAYILRCTSRIFAQIFKEKNFDWEGVFVLY